MGINPQDEELFAADLIDIIQSSKIFSEIDRTACESLLPQLEKMILKQGEILFEQGDASDCLYILVDGQLMASTTTPEGKQKVVGTVEKGETVGELGALSNQPRSLTIRAAVDSRILKLPRHEFEQFSKNNPKIISRIIDIIINRSQNTIKLISQKKIYKHIALIQGDDNTSLDKFISQIKKNLPSDTNYYFIEANPNEDSLSERIDRAEQASKSVIFVLDPHTISTLSSKINHIGSIYVVVDGDRPSQLSEFALKMLTRHQTPFTTQYDLVLLHAEKTKRPHNTMHWLKQADFTLHHHIRTHDVKAYQRLLRFMTGKAISVVFGGGGGKGWVSVGTLKCLIDNRLPIDAIGGASAGAVLAACYAMTLSYRKTFACYNKLIESVSRPFSFKNLTWPLISLISTKISTATVKKIFNDIQIEDLWIPFFAVSANLSTGKEHVHRTGNLWESIRATAAIPGVAPPMVIDGELYYDGGILNNLPVDQMQLMLGEESFLIAVCLTGTGENQKITRYNFPPVIPFRMGLLKKLHLGYQDYQFPPYFSTFLQALLLGSSAKEKANQLKADVLIAPDLSGYGLFDLGKKRINNLIDIGYHEMEKQIQQQPFLTRL